MNKILIYITITIATTLSGCCNGNKPIQYNADKLCEMPSIEAGYGLGVSACYAATTNNVLFIAGGCNFPDAPAAEGGKKVFYKGIYRMATDKPGTWEHVGDLPDASAYGANIQDGEKWYIVGGMNSEGATGKAYCIEIRDTISIKELSPLPCTVDNLAGTVYDNTLYIVGGNADGKASNRIFALNVNKDSTWKELPEMPGTPRVQPVCAGVDGGIYVWGGFSPATEKNEAIVHSDGVRYDIATGSWEEIGNIVGERGVITLSGGCAIAVDENTVIAEGGVDKEIFLDAISGRYQLVEKEEYMYKPAEWYRFNHELLVFDTRSKSWQTVGNNSSYARAGAQLARQGKVIYQIGGELKPGIRTPDIFRITVE